MENADLTHQVTIKLNRMVAQGFNATVSGSKCHAECLYCTMFTLLYCTMFSGYKLEPITPNYGILGKIYCIPIILRSCSSELFIKPSCL